MATFPAPGASGTAPSPPGLWQAGAGEPAAGDLQKTISQTIEQQVSRRIEQARIDTESKVKMELKQIRASMMAMDERLDQLIALLDGMQPQDKAEPALKAEEVGHFLSKTEQQWGQEIRTLKQELHQTILAHNHNADLIKHHKDTIDALRERCLKMQTSRHKTEEIQQQLQRLDARLKQQSKQRKLEPLFERLAALEMRVTQGAAGWGGYPRMPTAMGMPPGMTAPPPGIVPAAGEIAAAREKAAFKHPTDEEVAARLKRLSPSTTEAVVPAGPITLPTPAGLEGEA
eukprot:gb/GFBE01047732.1/.p1 GENE.gb/GFBE01047732.1/~~gb/GFBE01047732.1/.p1  ORF type:complete len:287 (+),score=65.26 gb/GFBE01047732.1/:1-861(+)